MMLIYCQNTLITYMGRYESFCIRSFYNFSNWYPLRCESDPVHSSLYIDKYDYKRDSMNADWGGVVMITEDVMNTVNGYSNLFWGWGKEDGDMATRIRKAGFQVAERNGTGYFTMLPHVHTWNFRSGKSQNSLESNFYDKTLVLGIQNERRYYDGLSSLRYDTTQFECIQSECY